MVERLVVVDVAPTFMPTTVDVEVLTYLRAMRETLKLISPEMSSPAARKEAEKHLGSVVQVGRCEVISRLLLKVPPSTAHSWCIAFPRAAE